MPGGPQTGYEELPGNRLGQVQAITVLTPMRPWGPLAGSISFWIALRFKRLALYHLRKLEFIHFARWAAVKRLPPNKDGRRLRSPYLLFESNFNGNWSDYLDAFSFVIPLQMRSVWNSSYGFPGPRPTGPFKSYAHRHQFEASHYYSAYPEATTTDVLAALRLHRELARLLKRAGAHDETIGTEFRQFLKKRQAL